MFVGFIISDLPFYYHFAASNLLHTMSRRAPSPTARRALRSNTKIIDDKEFKQNPYDQLRRSLNESHERSASPHHWSDNDAETDDENNDVDPIDSSGAASKNQSYDSSRSPPSTPRSHVNTSSSSSKATTPLKMESSSSAGTTESNLSTIVVCVIGFVVIVLAVWNQMPNSQSSSSASTTRKCEGFKDLSIKYPKYDQDMFLMLKFGVEDLLNKDPCKPSVFLFVHDGEIRPFINRVAEVSVNCLKTSSSIQLTSQDFKNPEMEEDYGFALAKYKDPLEQNSVMVVYDLGDVPAITAQAFHTICDTINPLVEKSIILLTLKVSQSQINATESANKIAETKLKQEWMGLAEDKLGPLITRVTDQVFVIKSS